MTRFRSKFRKIKDKTFGHPSQERPGSSSAGSGEIEQPPSAVEAEDEAAGDANAGQGIVLVDSAVDNDTERLSVDGENNTRPSSHAGSVKSTRTDSEEGADNTNDWRPSLWEGAFDLLKKRNEILVEKYMACIGLEDQPANPDNIAKAIQALMEKRESKKWRISISGSKSIEARDSAEVLLHFLKFSSDFITDAVKGQPYIALAWSAVGIIIPIIETAGAKNAAMLKGLVAISRLQLYWKACEETHLVPASQPLYKHLRQPLSEFYSCILEYHAHVICHLNRRQFGRGWEDVAGLRKWDELSKAVTEAESTARGFIQVGEREETRRSQNERYEQYTNHGKLLESSYVVQRELLDFQVDSRLDDKLKELCRHLRDSTSNYVQDKSFLESRVEGTCEWFFEHEDFLSWRDRDESALFWLSAGPGCGKSVLSKTLIDEGFLNVARISANGESITRSSTTVTYFFFKKTDASRTVAEQALSAILLQLVEQLKSRSDWTKKAVDKFNYQSKLGNSFKDAWLLLIECVNSPGLGDVICVLDALDECAEESCEELISSLKQLFASADNYKTASNLKFFITGRPELKITDKFKTFAPYTSFVELDGISVSDEIGADIEKVIDFRVNQFQDLQPAERDELAKRLKAMKSRTYLWLHLTFESIAQKKELFLSPETFNQALHHLPSNVTDAYEALLSNIPDKHRPMSTHLFRILLMAVRPLTIDEARDALNFAITGKPFSHQDKTDGNRLRGDFTTLVTKLCGLLVQIHESKLVFIHLTVKEFLLSEQIGSDHREWKGKFSKEAVSHIPFTKLCVSYLLLPGHPHPSIPLSETMNVPFLRYASIFWVAHYQELSKEGATTLNAEVREVCRVGSPAFRTWRSKVESAMFIGDADFMYRHRVLPEAPAIELNQDNRGWIDATDLYMATRCRFSEIVRMILEAEKSDPNDSLMPQTTLEIAFWTKDHRTAAILLENGADINQILHDTCRDHVLFLNEVSSKCQDAKITKLIQQSGVNMQPEILYRSKEYRYQRVKKLRKAFEKEHDTSDDVKNELFSSNSENMLIALTDLLFLDHQAVSFDQAALHFVKACNILRYDKLVTASRAEKKTGYLYCLFEHASTMSTPQTFIKLLRMCSSDREACKRICSSLILDNKPEHLKILLHDNSTSTHHPLDDLDKALSVFGLEEATLKAIMDSSFKDFDETMLIKRIRNASLPSDAIAHLWNIAKITIPLSHAVVEAAIQNDRFAILRDALKAHTSHACLTLAQLKSRVMKATIAGTVTPTETVLGLLHMDDTFQFTQQLFNTLMHWEKNGYRSFSTLLDSVLLRFPRRFAVDISDDDLLILANREDANRYLRGFYKLGLLASRLTWPVLQAHFAPFPHPESRCVLGAGGSLFLRSWLQGKDATAVIDILDYLIADQRYSGNDHVILNLIDIFEYTDAACVFNPATIHAILDRLLPVIRTVTRPRTFRWLLSKTIDCIELSDEQIFIILFNDNVNGHYFREFFYHSERLRNLREAPLRPFRNVSKETVGKYFKFEKAVYTSLLLLLREPTVRDYVSEEFMVANLDLMSDHALLAIHREMPERLSKAQLCRERVERKLEGLDGGADLFSIGNASDILLESTNGESALLQATKNTSVRRGFQRGYRLLIAMLQIPEIKINELDRDKHTAIWVAIIREQYEWVKLLSVAGADWYIEDADGVTPWEKLCKMAGEGEGSYWGVRRDLVKQLIDDPYRLTLPEASSWTEQVTQQQPGASEEDEPITLNGNYALDAENAHECFNWEEYDIPHEFGASVASNENDEASATTENNWSLLRVQEKQREQYLLRDCAL